MAEICNLALTKHVALFQNLDLREHRLIYDGQLTMKLGETKRFKTIDLHVLLLEDCIMLLQRQDDKYLLKVTFCHSQECPVWCSEMAPCLALIFLVEVFRLQ